MGKDALNLPHDAWPEYFQPRTGQEDLRQTEEAPCIPTGLLDLLYLRRSEGTQPEFVTVAACLGGSIAAIPDDRSSALPEDLRDQLQILTINQRARFRLITAVAVDIFRLDAMKQGVQASGFNDAVFLYGQLHARLAYSLENLEIRALQNEGRLTIGRLDLLQSVRESLLNPLSQPGADDQKTYQFFIPTGAPAEIRSGRSLALLYPTLDPDVFEQTDNAAFTMQIAYDLLVKLREDMQKEGINAPFTHAQLPVPDRKKIETDLADNGYVITGDTAVKRADWDATVAGKTFLGRVRQLADAKSAPPISVPRQANPNDYVAAIDEALHLVATREDRDAMQAVIKRVVRHFSPAQQPERAIPQPTARPRPVDPAPPVEQQSIRAPTAARKEPEQTAARAYAGDFASRAASAAQPAPPVTAWWVDFDGTPDRGAFTTPSYRDFTSAASGDEKRGEAGTNDGSGEAKPMPEARTDASAVFAEDIPDQHGPAQWHEDFPSAERNERRPSDGTQTWKKEWKGDFS